MRRIEELIDAGELNFEGIDTSLFLLGLLSAFDNRYQAKADSFFQEVSWKQFFAIICINLCDESPTIKELAEIMGSSHQNVKQILNKLEDKGFVKTILDKEDKRKQRVYVTEKCERFCQSTKSESENKIRQMFDGIPEEQIITTIQTIAKMERNLEKL